MSLEIWSIGHSTHPLEELVELLEAHGIQRIADIRTVPKSRRNPQFQAEALRESLPARGIEYDLHPLLGGWRKTAPDSPNGAWRNDSFRGYADYAMTADFQRGVAELLEIAAEKRTAMMCSEGLWWRCHRRIVADRLVCDGATVHHIGTDGRITDHELIPFASVSPEGVITYPADAANATG